MMKSLRCLLASSMRRVRAESSAPWCWVVVATTASRRCTSPNSFNILTTRSQSAAFSSCQRIRSVCSLAMSDALVFSAANRASR